jgi:hypothetical protein
VLPGEIRHESDLSLVLSGSTAIVHTVRYVNGVSTYTLLWIDQQGDVLRRETVKLGQEQWWSNPRSEAIVASLALPAPAIVTPGIALVEPALDVGPGEALDYPTAVARSLAVTWPALLVLNAVGAGLAWLVYRRHRRLGQPWAGAWAVFVFLFGVPGLLGYLFHRSWPVRVACPRCAEVVPRDREVCLACGQQFPEPPRKGTEVLL